MASFQFGDVALNAPDGYVARMVVLAAPLDKADGARFSRNVVMACEEVPAGTTADSYSKKQLGLLGSGSMGFKVSKTGKIQICGAACPLIESTSVGPGGLPLASVSAYLVKGTTAFTLSASHLQGAAFAKAKDEFVKLFASFTVPK